MCFFCDDKSQAYAGDNNTKCWTAFLAIVWHPVCLIIVSSTHTGELLQWSTEHAIPQPSSLLLILGHRVGVADPCCVNRLDKPGIPVSTWRCGSAIWPDRRTKQKELMENFWKAMWRQRIIEFREVLWQTEKSGLMGTGWKMCIYVITLLWKGRELIALLNSSKNRIVAGGVLTKCFAMSDMLLEIVAISLTIFLSLGPHQCS